MKFIVLTFICLSSAFATTPDQFNRILLNSISYFNKEGSIGDQELKSIILLEKIPRGEKIYKTECLNQLAEYSRSSYLLNQSSENYFFNYKTMANYTGSPDENSIMLFSSEKTAQKLINLSKEILLAKNYLDQNCF